MKILFLCKRYYTNKDLIDDQFGRLYHLPVQLAKQGESVEVLAIDYRNTRIINVQYEGVTFSTIPATPTQLPILPIRLYRVAQKARPDIIIASGDSHIGFFALHIARRLGARFVFDVYDYYPVFFGNRIPGMKAMFRAAVSGADQVLCASFPLQQRLAQINAASALIENGIDRTIFKPLPLSKARQSLGIPPAIPLIGYFGSITPQRGPLLIEACHQLRKDMPMLQLLLAGPLKGVDTAEPWIDYRGVLTQGSIPTLIAACDVVTLPYANDAFNSMAGACKIAEYLACGKPVVATNVSGHGKIFTDATSNLCLPNPESMADALRRQLASPEVQPFPASLNWQDIGEYLHCLLCRPCVE